MKATMTEAEASLQAQLDAEPWSATLRKVLADHLEDVGDERAAGYRALGVLGLWPHEDSPPRCCGAQYWAHVDSNTPASANLPGGWWGQYHRVAGFRRYDRREADDAAAKAFSRLPADVQAAILAGATA